MAEVQVETHVPTYTEHRGVGVICSCGWVWGMGNRLGAERAHDNHVCRELIGEPFHD